MTEFNLSDFVFEDGDIESEKVREFINKIIEQTNTKIIGKCGPASCNYEIYTKIGWNKAMEFIKGEIINKAGSKLI